MDESDYEYATTVPGYEHDYYVQVDKVGGGTVGKRYDGDWTVTVSVPGGDVVLSNELLHTGTGYTHDDVADVAAEFAAVEMDEG